MKRSRKRSSLNSRITYLLTSFIAFHPGCLLGQESLQFDKLSSCFDVTEVFSEITIDEKSVSRNCRLPINDLEKAIRKRTGPNTSEYQYCFSNPPLVDSLAGFSCIQSHSKETTSVACIRPANAVLVSDYRDAFHTKYAEVIRGYLEKASQCEWSNGDSSVDALILIPAIVSVSKPEFGFRIGFGRERVATSFVQHGFASVDETIVGNTPSAIEYVSFVKNAKQESKSQEQKELISIGDLEFSIDTDDKIFQPLAEMASRNMPMEVRFTALSLSTNSKTSQPNRISLISSLENILSVIEEYMKNEKLNRISNDEMRRLGISGEIFAEKFSEATPFGMRHWKWTKNVIGRNFEFQFYMIERHPSCSSDGAIMAFVVKTGTDKSGPNASSDTVIFFAGIAGCAKGQKVNRYLDNLRDGLIFAVRNRLTGSAKK